MRFTRMMRFFWFSAYLLSLNVDALLPVSSPYFAVPNTIKVSQCSILEHTVSQAITVRQGLCAHPSVTVSVMSPPAVMLMISKDLPCAFSFSLSSAAASVTVTPFIACSFPKRRDAKALR